jgi:hypothetical protein
MNMAGLGALFFVAHRVWQSLSRAEPIDVYPLLRPFVIGFCIMLFPTFVLGTINAVMSGRTRMVARRPCNHVGNVRGKRHVQPEKEYPRLFP